jgi:hypothetical protein
VNMGRDCYYKDLGTDVISAESKFSFTSFPPLFDSSEILRRNIYRRERLI